MLLGQSFGRRNPVDARHFDVHQDQVWLERPGKVDGRHPIAGLADHGVPEMLEHFAQIHARDGFVLCKQDACARHQALLHLGYPLRERHDRVYALPVRQLELAFKIFAYQAWIFATSPSGTKK